MYLWIWVVVGLLGALHFAAFIRDEFISNEEWREKLRILALLPQWTLSTWVILTLGLLLVVLFEGSYRRHLKVKIENSELKERLRPKIKCAFHKKVPGCFVRTFFTHTKQQANYVRLRIDADTVGYIPECIAHLTAMTRNGVKMFEDEAIALPIAPAERQDPTFKNIYDGVPAFADLLVLTDKNEVFFPPNVYIPNSINLQTLFAQTGDYTFTVVVSSPITVSRKEVLKFQWAGDWNSAEIDRL